MARAADLRAIEDDCPWVREDFRAGLERLRCSTAAAAQAFAGDMRVLADLARQVPRCPMDERGATPWTSFRREVAVARTLSDRGAAAEIRAAIALTELLPRAMSLLEAGSITVQRARAFITDVEGLDPAVASQIDDALAERVAGLPLWRISQEVQAAAARLDPDSAAGRTAEKNAGRSVILMPDADDQASVCITGPAVPLVRWYETLDQRARALKAAGDARTLDALRFDLATSTFPCAAHAPAAPRAAAEQVTVPWQTPTGQAAAGLRPSFVESSDGDCRMSRPVQAGITMPVETALGLSSEPGWLDGFGWLSAPTCRLLLADAELRRVCVHASTGQLVGVAERDVRPPPTPEGVRSALLDMVLGDMTISDPAWRTESQHDPSPPLRELVELRDRFCDGPTGTRTAARRADLDHESPHPLGPTAAWNLAARGRRTHQLKHFGWTPLRTPTSTLWFSPAGQLVETPRHQQLPPGIDVDPGGEPAALPDPTDLTRVDEYQLQAPPSDQPLRRWLAADERVESTKWVWLDEAPDLPF
jgi:hypothetical protein